MGVTAHFFAFDPGAYAAPPTLDRLVAAGHLDRELEVVGAASRSLRAIATPLGDNKRWADNLAGDFAWDRVRRHIEPGARGELDAWLSHLFWDAEDDGCRCGRGPVSVADDEVIYDADLVDHVLTLERPLDALRSPLAAEFAGDPPPSPRLHRPWIYDFDGFCGLVDAWQRIFERTRRAGPGWCLLRWVWW